MGLNVNNLRFLLLAHARGVVFGNVLMIGRQSLTVTARDVRQLLGLPISNDVKTDLRHLRLGPGVYAEQFFELMGATRVHSMDKAAYEGATVLHDLNMPVPEAVHRAYDLIVDGGSIEHVFNVPMAFTNYMKMLRVGGHYVCNTAINNYSGHGFYQLSPELFFAAFSPENGFLVLEACMYEENGKNHWYRLRPPSDARRRLTFQNDVPAHILVLARKTAEATVFADPPQQRMYAAAWANPEAAVAYGTRGIKAVVLRSLDHLPARIKWLVLNTWNTRNRFRKDLFTPVVSDDVMRG
jgi:hypothetical protein